MKYTFAFIPMLPFIFPTQQSKITLHQQHKVDKLKKFLFPKGECHGSILSFWQHTFTPSSVQLSSTTNPCMNSLDHWIVSLLELGMGNTFDPAQWALPEEVEQELKEFNPFQGFSWLHFTARRLHLELWWGTPRDAWSRQIPPDFQTKHWSLHVLFSCPPQTLKHFQTRISNKQHQNKAAPGIWRWTWWHLFSSVSFEFRGFVHI